MEIKYNDIEAFVRKAMLENIYVTGVNSEYESSIFISKKHEEVSDYYDIRMFRYKVDINSTIRKYNELEVFTSYGRFIVELSDKEIALFDVLIEDIKEYEINKSINVFNTYFKDEYLKKKDIEDLNMEEDDGNNN
jgi:hypothetical protein